MSAARDAGPVAADQALMDQVRALHTDAALWLAGSAALPLSADRETALGWYIDRHSAAVRLMPRLNAILLQLELDNGNPTRICTCEVGGFCGEKATEVLVVEHPDGRSEHPRCREHRSTVGYVRSDPNVYEVAHLKDADDILVTLGVDYGRVTISTGRWESGGGTKLTGEQAVEFDRFLHEAMWEAGGYDE